MFEHFTTPEEIFSFKLASALTMEKDSLDLLTQLAETTHRPELKQMFSDRITETRDQIGRIETSFTELGEEINEAPSPVTKGLAKEGKASISKTDDSIIDAVILAGALEATHYEIAVYEVLVTNAEARNAPEVARLLTQNLQQEEAAKQLIKTTAKKISTEGIAYPAA